MAFALVDDGATDLRDRWPVADQPIDDQLREVISDIAAGRSLRGGRLLAPFGVRYVIVPVLDGATSTAEDPLPVPEGLLGALGAQLDIVRQISPPDFARFENRAVIPTSATMDGALAEASQTDDLATLVAVDTSTATPILTGVDRSRSAAADAPAGSISFATPLDEAWRMTAGGTAVAGRTSFGVVSAYDLPAAGPVELRYDQPVSRTLLLVVQSVLWVVVLVAASRLTVPTRLRGRRGPRRDAHRPRRRSGDRAAGRHGGRARAHRVRRVGRRARRRRGVRAVIVRRLPMLGVCVAGLVGVVVVDRDPAEPVQPVFAVEVAPWMPSVPEGGELTSTWFCAGVPGGAEGTSGQVVLANAGQAPMEARVTFLAGVGEATEQAVTVGPYQRSVIDVTPSATTPYVSAVVDIDGGGGLVEQRATTDAGTSVAPCTTQPSQEWYLAEGFTAEDSSEQLVLTNPADGPARVEIGFATSAGSREPSELQGFPIPARSVRVIDMDSIAARDEAEVAVKIDVSRGTVIAGRAQVYDGGGRLGYSMTLAAPALRSQWWFANGDRGDGVTERFSIYNPTDDDVTLTPVYLGISEAAQVVVEPISVPARQVVTFTSDDVQGLPDGRHAVVFATDDFSESVVVERAITRTIDEIPTTSVLAGGTSRIEDAFIANTWTLAVGPGEPTDDGLIVYNTTGADATVTLQAVTPDGYVNVPGYEAVALGAGAILVLPLTDPMVLDSQLVVRSTQRVFVERALPREPGAQGRSASWAVPVAPVGG